MKQLGFLFVACLLCSVLTIRAVAEDTLTWEDCIKEALKNHPDLISGKEKVKQTEADRDITSSARVPQVTSEMNGRRSKAATQTETDTYS